jgi:O-glycosyl hydrolase
MTAAYPFVQSVAFKTPTQETILVVLNENTEAASFTIKEEKGRFYHTSIPANAIQTYVW